MKKSLMKMVQLMFPFTAQPTIATFHMTEIPMATIPMFIPIETIAAI